MLVGHKVYGFGPTALVPADIWLQFQAYASTNRFSRDCPAESSTPIKYNLTFSLEIMPKICIQSPEVAMQGE